MLIIVQKGNYIYEILCIYTVLRIIYEYIFTYVKRKMIQRLKERWIFKKITQQ